MPNMNSPTSQLPGSNCDIAYIFCLYANNLFRLSRSRILFMIQVIFPLPHRLASSANSSLSFATQSGNSFTETCVKQEGPRFDSCGTSLMQNFRPSWSVLSNPYFYVPVCETLVILSKCLSDAPSNLTFCKKFLTRYSVSNTFCMITEIIKLSHRSLHPKASFTHRRLALRGSWETNLLRRIHDAAAVLISKFDITKTAISYPRLWTPYIYAALFVYATLRK
jgi:hypothetical protein